MQNVSMIKKNGPIVIVDDDGDDRDFFRAIYENCGAQNEIVFIKTADEAILFLTTLAVDPFLVICGVNYPAMDGLRFRQQICANPDLLKKCAPFVFFTTFFEKSFLVEAHNLDIQGLFQKSGSYAHLEHSLNAIINYWNGHVFESDQSRNLSN